MDYDYLIVGSGLAGATFAYLANQEGKRCLVIEKRNHIGGNIYCENIEGINVHKYGAHIFHTNNKKVWDFVNQFVTFNRFTNSPLANYKGKLYNLPFNMNTFHQLWGVNTPEEAWQVIEKQRAEIGDIDISTLEGYALSSVGYDIYKCFIKDYTEKQWGRPCCELPASIIKRIPLRFTYDNNYFNDQYQGIPTEGYNKLIDSLLKDIEIIQADFVKEQYGLRQKAKKIIFTGPIDSYFNYCFGHLEYRSLDFHTEILNVSNFQGNAVVNYTDNTVPYTRIIEHKHFQNFGDEVYFNSKTVITKEYSIECNTNKEPYYPINNTRNNVLLQKYQKLSKNYHDVIFVGRLGEYKYYDMAPTIENSIKLWEYERER